MSDYPMLISNKLHSFRNFMFAKILKYKQFVWCAAVSIAVEMLFLPIKNLKRNQTGATVWEICVFRK